METPARVRHQRLLVSSARQFVGAHQRGALADEGFQQLCGGRRSVQVGQERVDHRVQRVLHHRIHRVLVDGRFDRSCAQGQSVSAVSWDWTNFVPKLGWGVVCSKSSIFQIEQAFEFYKILVRRQISGALERDKHTSNTLRWVCMKASCGVQEKESIPQLGNRRTCMLQLQISLIFFGML